MSPTLLIVTGPPCAGKTTLARRLAADLRLPLFTKDDLKEIMFDALGWGDRDHSRRLGMASNELLYHLAAAMLCAANSLALESNFDPAYANAAFQRILDRRALRPIQVLVTAPPDVLAARWRERATTAMRHPGHLDQAADLFLDQEMLLRRHVVLDLPGPVLAVNTADFGERRYAELLDRLAALLPG